MTPGLTYQELLALNPCEDALKRALLLIDDIATWNERKVSAVEARCAGIGFDDILWAAASMAKNDKDVKRRLQLWTADCAARVLYIFEDVYPQDPRPRTAIVTARQYARGEINSDAMQLAADAAYASAAVADTINAYAAAFVAHAAANAVDIRVADYAFSIIRYAAIATNTVYARTSGIAKYDTERAWQFDRLIEWLGPEEPNDWPLPEISTEPTGERNDNTASAG